MKKEFGEFFPCSKHSKIEVNLIVCLHNLRKGLCKRCLLFLKKVDELGIMNLKSKLERLDSSGNSHRNDLDRKN